MPNGFLFSKAKIVSVVLLATILLGGLAACGGDETVKGPSKSASGSVVNLSFWSWVSGIDKSVELFNQTHPNIHVTLSNVGGGPTEYNKLYTAIKANNEPDLAQVEFQLLPTFMTTGALVNLSKYGADEVKDKFVPWTWSQVSIDNAVYAIPQDTGPLALYYRADIFEQYGIPVPTTWDEYAQAAEKLHAADPTKYITDFPPREPGWFSGLVWQAGGQMFDIDGEAWKVSINNTGAQKVATFWQNMLQKKLVKTNPDFSSGWYHDLQTGEISTWISAVWGAGTISANAPQTSGKWRVAPIPQWEAGQHVNGNWGGSTTVVFNNTAHPKEATEFALWLNTNQQSLDAMITGSNIYPAYQPALDSPLVNKAQPFFGNQNLGELFKSESANVDVNFQWGPTIDQVYNDFGDNFAAVANDQGTLANALDSIQTGTVIFMRRQGFTVVT